MFVSRVGSAAPASAATILHADLDSFYASVEQRDDPALRGRPVIVGGGVVLAASYEAKAYGVQTAMGGRQARVVPARRRRAAPDVGVLTGQRRGVRGLPRHHTRGGAVVGR
jgi:DNA polymerase IV